MASRFDVIPTFNPYIEEIPTDVFTQVGLVKQQEYAKGVERVQSYVDTLSSLDIVKPEDKNMLAEKLTNLAGDISKFSGEDFSNPLLQGRLTQMAAGVYKDQGIQNAVLGTQQYRRKQSQIEQIRAKNPELYNPDNEAYALTDINNWLNDGKAGTQLVDNHTYYNYYDYSKEVRDAMANFKPTSTRTKLPNGEWMITNEDKSWNENELKEYLSSVLSDRAKQQMKVESTVAFNGRDPDLLQAYYDRLKSSKKDNTRYINDLAAKVSVVRDPTVASAMKQQIENLKNQNLEYDNAISKVDTGDLNFFIANKENVAQWLFQNAYIDQVANGFSHPDVTLEYTPNDVWNTKFVQSMINARQNAQQEFQAHENALNRANAIKAAKIRAGKDDENTIPNLLKSGANVGESDKHSTSKAEFDKQKENIRKENTDNYLFLRNKLLAESPDLRRIRQSFIDKGGKDNSTSDPTFSAVMEYIRQEKSKPKDKRSLWFNEFVDKSNALDVRQDILTDKEREIEEQTLLQYGDIYANAKDAVKNIAPINVPILTTSKITPAGTTSITGSVGNQQITPDDVLAYLTGNLDPTKYGIIDKALKQAPGMGQRNNLRDYIENIKSKIGGKERVKRLNDALEYREDLYKQELLNLGDWWTPVDRKDKKYIQTVNYLTNQVGGKPEEFSIARVNQTTGEIQFKISPQKSSNINTDLMESLGYTYDDLNDTYTATALPELYKRQGLNNLNSTERELIKALDVNVNIPQVGYYTPISVYDPNGNGEYIQVVKDRAPDGSFRYFLRHENSKTTLDKQVFADPVSAINAAKVLTADKQQLQQIIDGYR